MHDDSPGHPVGWFTYASALTPGDKLAEPGGRLIAVTKTRAYRANLTAYNLSISGIHTYYVLGDGTAVLVHNDCTDPSGQVDYGTTDLGKATANARRNPVTGKIMTGHNGASDRFVYPDRTSKIITMFSDSAGHAETKLASSNGLTKLVAVYSELKPCVGTYQCWNKLSAIPGIQISWTFDWTTSGASQASRGALKNAILGFFSKIP